MEPFNKDFGPPGNPEKSVGHSESSRSKIAVSARETAGSDAVIAITRTTPRIHEIPVFVPLKDTLRCDVHERAHVYERRENRF